MRPQFGTFNASHFHQNSIYHPLSVTSLDMFSGDKGDTLRNLSRNNLVKYARNTSKRRETVTRARAQIPALVTRPSVPRSSGGLLSLRKLNSVREPGCRNSLGRTYV